MPTRIIFDIETNGLLAELTKVHSLVLRDADTGTLIGSYFGDTIREGIRRLQEADFIVGHNILDFDLRAIEKVYPEAHFDRSKALDTFLMISVLEQDRKHRDFPLFRQGKLPGQMIGRHGLEAWGYRLGKHKGDYKDWCRDNGIEDPWSDWRQEMQDYCELDTEVNLHVWRRINEYGDILNDPNGGYRPWVKLEHDACLTCLKITENGFPFDEDAAAKLYVTILERREAAEGRLRVAFPPIERKTIFIPKRKNKKLGYQEGVPVEKVSLEDFNPGSTQQIVERLQLKYGWEPQEFTEPSKTHPKGQPKVDEDTLNGLPYPEVPDLINYLNHAKIVGLMDGKKGWLKLVRKGLIHTDYNTVGTVTGRASHLNPNIAQTPKVQSNKLVGILKDYEGGYGWECRSLYSAPAGWVLVGADMSGLELRCLAHYLEPYDGGRYVSLVTVGDVHTANMDAAGLPSRDKAKTFIYAFLYGSGAWNLGHLVAPHLDDREKAKLGTKLIKAFLKKTPGLKALREDVVEAWNSRGYLMGLDRRPLYPRSAHSALNTLLQSAGAILCKWWITRVVQRLEALGYHHGNDFRFLAWVHDEVQIAGRTQEIAETIKRVAVEACAEAGEFFKCLCPLTGEGKTGRTWAETH